MGFLLFDNGAVTIQNMFVKDDSHILVIEGHVRDGPKDHHVHLNCGRRHDGQFWVDGYRDRRDLYHEHDVALLVAAHDQQSRNQSHAVPSHESDLSPTVANWLNQIPLPPQDIYPVLPPNRYNRPAVSQNHIFYVIYHDSSEQVEIHVYRIYLKIDGTIGKKLERCYNWNFFRLRKYMTAQDAKILDQLGYMQHGRGLNQFAWPRGEQSVKLIRQIIETGRAVIYEITGTTAKWSESRRCKLIWKLAPFGYQRIVAIDENGSVLELLPLPKLLFLDTNTGEIGVAETGLPDEIAEWVASAPMVDVNSAAAVSERLTNLVHQDKIEVPRRLEIRNDIAPEPVLVLFGDKIIEENSQENGNSAKNSEITDIAVFPCIRLEFAYPGANQRVRAGLGDQLIEQQDASLTLIHRDMFAENDFQDHLKRMTSSFYNETFIDDEWKVDDEWDEDEEWGKDDGHGTLDCSSSVLNADVIFPLVHGVISSGNEPGLEFFVQHLPTLRSRGWRIEIDESWPFHLHEGEVEFSTSLETSETDWFSLRLLLDADGNKINIGPIVLQLIAGLPVDEFGNLQDGFDIEAHLTGKNFYARLDGGNYIELDSSRFARFAAAFLEVQGLLNFHMADAGRLSSLAEALEGCGVPWTGGNNILQLGAKLRALPDTPELEPPTSLKGELRPYQRMGYAWLKALSETGFGGVLADDMGLGKTIQTLALLAQRHLEEGTDRPSLLIVPTTLIGNWRIEARKFVPSLKLLVLHGPNRHRHFCEIPDHHLIITTYPLLHQDSQRLFSTDYEIAVLDEAQAVKNPTSGVAKRIRDIRARQRIALTGTPMENNLQELWALYDWLVPGLLGNRKQFTKNYRTPIEKRGDHAKQRLLTARVKPFLLRRTKREVTPELPQRTIIDEMITLEGAQATLYESIRTTMDRQVRNAIAMKGLAASQIAILDALLKLRQVCCDPGLVKLNAARKVTKSAKRERLLELLEELVAEGHKVLIFSQFVEMLKLIEQDIVAQGWGYSMLHGSTRHRDEQVAAFQSGKLPLFLLSLKVGGTGLNLTAADTVIVYDPWWNPATEQQAMDRAHRIGQDKPVFVHRLIAENTVESVIQRMQLRKQALADALFEGTGKGPMSLTDSDIDALFGPST